MCIIPKIRNTDLQFGTRLAEKREEEGEEQEKEHKELQSVMRFTQTQKGVLKNIASFTEKHLC